MTAERAVALDAVRADRSVRTKYVVAGSAGRGRDGDGGRMLTPPSRRDSGVAEGASVDSVHRAVGAHDPVTPGRGIECDARRGGAEGETPRSERAVAGCAVGVHVAVRTKDVVTVAVHAGDDGSDGRTGCRRGTQVRGVVRGQRRRR